MSKSTFRRDAVGSIRKAWPVYAFAAIGVVFGIVDLPLSIGRHATAATLGDLAIIVLFGYTIVGLLWVATRRSGDGDDAPEKPEA